MIDKGHPEMAILPVFNIVKQAEDIEDWRYNQ